jgi:hypothetical protein
MSAWIQSHLKEIGNVFMALGILILIVMFAVSRFRAWRQSRAAATATVPAVPVIAPPLAAPEEVSKPSKFQRWRAARKLKRWRALRTLFKFHRYPEELARSIKLRRQRELRKLPIWQTMRKLFRLHQKKPAQKVDEDAAHVASFQNFRLVNRSFAIAAIVSFVVGLFIGQALMSHVPGAYFLIAKLVVGFAVCGAWLTWVSYNTPTAHKSAVFFFGTLRFRMGPEGKGLMEGLNATPLGWPFFTVEDKYAQEKTIEFKQTKAYAKGNIPVKLQGTFNPFIDDVYKTYNIKLRVRKGTEEVSTDDFDGEVKNAITSLVLKHVRVSVEEFTPEQLIAQELNVEGNVEATKKILAKRALKQINEELEEEADWGWRVKPTLQINDIELDTPYETSLANIGKAKLDVESSNISLDGRLAQIDRAKQHMDPNLAAAFAQVEAGKPGATINTVNVPGAHALAKSIGDGVAAWLSKQTGGTQ